MGLFSFFKKNKIENTNNVVLKKEPISEEEKNKIIETLPQFEYHPNLYKIDYVEFDDVECSCCGKEVKAYIDDDICLDCIKNGKAYKEELWFGISNSEDVSDPKKKEILYKRTPGYHSWQGEYWLACCDDFCEFIGNVGIEELDKLGITNEVIDEYCEKFKVENKEFIKQNLSIKGEVAGYLFRCKHCKKYHLYVDMA